MAFDLPDQPGFLQQAEVLQMIGSNQCGVAWLKLRGGLREGVELVLLCCAEKQVAVIPSRGMGLGWAFHSGVRFGWDSPVRGPVHPHWVPVDEPSGLGWLDGFDELMVRCGLNSNGAPEFNQQGQLVHPLHGRIANLPACGVRIACHPEAGWVSVSGMVNEARFHFSRLSLESSVTLTEDSDTILIQDRITNQSDRPATCQLLYHNNFGSPILDAGSRVYAPVKRVVPRNEWSARQIGSWDQFGAPIPQEPESVYFMELAADDRGRTLAVLADEDQKRGAAIEFSAQDLPCFSLWKNPVGRQDGYVAGLEPATNFPNPKSFEQNAGRVLRLAPGEAKDFDLGLGMLVTRSAVEQAIDQVHQRTPGSPRIETEPAADWCAD